MAGPEGDIPNSQNHDKEEDSKKKESFKEPNDRVIGKKKDTGSKNEPGKQEEESKKEKKDLSSSNKKNFRELIKIASLSKLNEKDFQKILEFGTELRAREKISDEQFQNLKILLEKRRELGKINKKIDEINKNYSKRFSGFMPSKEWQDIPPGVPIPPGGEIKMDMKTGKNRARWDDPYEGMSSRRKEELEKSLNKKQKLEEEIKFKESSKSENKKEPLQERKVQDKTLKEEGLRYRNLIQEINRVYEKIYYPKNEAEKIEAERQIKVLEMKREEYIRRARAGGWIEENVNKRVESVREAATRGKIFFSDLIRESGTLIPDPEGIPQELQGINQDYYQKEVLKIIGEKSTPTDKKQQTERLREYLKILRTIRLAPQSIANNPIWNEMISAIAYFDPELQKEFKARLEIFQYGLNFKDASGVEEGIAGASRIHLSHISRALKVPEIQKAYDLLEETSEINIGQIIESYKPLKNEEERKIRAGEEIGERNPLYAGSDAQRKEALNEIALKLAKSCGEKTGGLNKEEKNSLAEKYMWAVDEAEDIWRITGRADENDINIQGKGGQFWLNRLFYWGARLIQKKFGYESTRKYFNKPFLPVWIEDEPILPVLKGEKLEISETDINMLREKFKAKGLDEKGIEKRIRVIKQKLLEGRGLMMKGFLDYQIDYLLKKEVWLEKEGRKGNELEKIGFNKEKIVRYTKDGNGNELPYEVYRKEFISPSGEKKEMIVRAAVDKSGKTVGVINIENSSAQILSEIYQQAPEGFYGSYVGDWIVKAENTRKLLEAGVLKFPLGSEDDMKRVLAELQSKNLFDHLDSLAKDNWERKPGKYYQEDAYEDLIRGSIDFGLHEGKKMFESWKMWGAWRAGVLTKLATDLKVITDEQGRKIENDMLPFLGMRGNIPRWLRCNFDRYTMVFRWGPMRMMMLGEMLKRFFEGIFQGPPFAPSK